MKQGPSNCPYASPIHFIKKRFEEEFLKLNAVIDLDSYSYPHIQVFSYGLADFGVTVRGSINYDEIALAQDSDGELRSLLESVTDLGIKQLSLPSPKHLIFFRCFNWFSYIYIDVVEPFPPSRDYKFILTYIDRFSRWLKAFPMFYQTAETVLSTWFFKWISRFRVPEMIITDRGRFVSITDEISRHPQDENHRFPFHIHRSCSEDASTTQSIYLMLHYIKLVRYIISHPTWYAFCLKEDIGASPSELAKGQCTCLPGELLRNSSPHNQTPN
ncbi:gag-Pol polyprotein [Nephila pilipes]|uniref:Gag-Pol polyprotein n=1 Tax=Nephila pilipes TaxID=299642 RepID=A0A8X6TMW1_NEPPI|nr:gag-Pol polyprotein [Nephila pilipes]